jgi:hypothetical protein
MFIYVGSSKNFLFSVTPRLRLFRSLVGSNGAFQWLNSKSYGMPHGIGFGGTVENFRFFIPESFEECKAQESCLTYEPGFLTHEPIFDIDCLEIWAVGGKENIDQALAARKEHRYATDKNIERAKTVDRAQFFNNQFDREFLLTNTFSHQTSQERPEI